MIEHPMAGDPGPQAQATVPPYRSRSKVFRTHRGMPAGTCRTCGEMIVQTEPATERLPATWEHLGETGRPAGVWAVHRRVGKPESAAEMIHPAEPVLAEPDLDADGGTVA